MIILDYIAQLTKKILEDIYMMIDIVFDLYQMLFEVNKQLTNLLDVVNDVILLLKIKNKNPIMN
jgi:hypothetical protein